MILKGLLYGCNTCCNNLGSHCGTGTHTGTGTQIGTGTVRACTDDRHSDRHSLRRCGLVRQAAYQPLSPGDRWPSSRGSAIELRELLPRGSAGPRSPAMTSGRPWGATSGGEASEIGDLEGGAGGRSKSSSVE